MVVTSAGRASVPRRPAGLSTETLRRLLLGAASVAGALSLAGALLAVRLVADPLMLGLVDGLLGVAALASLAGGLAGARLAHQAARDGLAGEALHLLSAAYCVVTPEGGMTYANAATQALFPTGQPPLAVLRAAIDDEEQLRLLERLEAGALTGRAGHAVLRVKLGRPEPSAVDLKVTPLPGQPRRTLWRIEDVTEREKRFELVAADRAQMLEIFDEVPIGLYAVDEAGRFLMLNETLAGWLGSTPEALLREGARLQDFLLAGPEGGERPPFDPYAPVENAEIVLRGRQGRLIKASVSQAVERREGGQVRTRSVLRDLSSQRTWEDALRAVRQRFQRFFEIAPVGIALVERDSRFKETNRALEALLSDGRDALVGRPLLDFVAEDQRGEVRDRLAAVLAGEPIARPLELRLVGARTVALFVSRLEAEEGGLEGLILHFIDLTEQKNLEAQFAQSQKMQAVGQLAGGVAHDFNNLLTAMIGFCDLLLMRFRPGDQSFADIMQVKQNANRAANLVRQLLAFSRQQTLQPRIINIGEVLSELSHLLNRLLGDNIELKMIHGRNLGPVKVDQGQLEQVIINLAVNARDAMTGGGTLTIKTSSVESKEPIRRELETMPAGSYVLIEVSDDGTGIPREIIGRIFEPFFSTKEVGSGTGLGLSTVYGIVKQTGGFIFVESEVGVGTRFSIYLPQNTKVPEAEEARPVESQAPRDLTGAGTVLLVEDEDPVRLFSSRALRNKGYNVIEAKSGEAALKVIEDGEHQIDLIITDVVMPRMDGPTMIKQVRERLPDIKVIFISGYTEDAFRKRLDDDADIQFLPKPFSLKQLAAKVKEIMPEPAA